MFDAHLKCYYCPQELTTDYPDFAELAEHVVLFHMGRKRVDCSANMASASLTSAERGNMPRREGDLIVAPEPERGESADFHPWLTVEHLGRKGEGTIKLLGNVRKSESTFGEGIVIDASLNGDTFSWTVKYSSGNYARLRKRFGDRFNKWRGPVKVKVKQYMNKDYVAVV
jgi:hypothetical protein